MRDRLLAEVELREDVRAKDTLELVGRNLGDRVVGRLVGGVVDEDVETPELFDRAGDDFAALLPLADVAGNGDAFPALFLLLSVVWLVKTRRRFGSS